MAVRCVLGCGAAWYHKRLFVVPGLGVRSGVVLGGSLGRWRVFWGGPAWLFWAVWVSWPAWGALVPLGWCAFVCVVGFGCGFGCLVPAVAFFAPCPRSAFFVGCFLLWPFSGVRFLPRFPWLRCLPCAPVLRFSWGVFCCLFGLGFEKYSLMHLEALDPLRLWGRRIWVL